jgi:hypothetical protein
VTKNAEETSMVVRIRKKIGDAFEIPLSDGRLAYCQYVLRKEDFGDLVRVFNLLSPEPLESAEPLLRSNILFPPVFAALVAAVRYGIWKRIGNLPVEPFEFPKFRQTMGTKPGTHYDWRIWDGKKTRMIGELPASLRSLELKCIWGCEALSERIGGGTYRGDRMF